MPEQEWKTLMIIPLKYMAIIMSTVSQQERLMPLIVSGIIAANRNNNIGMNGVADKVKIMSLRVAPQGDEYDKDVALGIRYAVDNGAKVINASFGKSHSPNREWVYDAIKYAAEKDVLLVFSSGNNGQNIDEIPTFPK